MGYVPALLPFRTAAGVQATEFARRRLRYFLITQSMTALMRRLRARPSAVLL